MPYECESTEYDLLVFVCARERERALGMSIAKVIALSTASLLGCAGEREREPSTGYESESTEYDLPVCVCERESIGDALCK
jgi:hypothetical protein